MRDKIWLSSPHMGGAEQEFVNQAFAENWIAPLGPNVNGFEADLENYLQEEVQVAALSSGTAALHLALIMAGVEADDEVLCQSMTFSASANPIVYQGATPIFIDSEKDTWNLCPEAVEAAIKDRITKGKKPKAVIGVHLYGMPFKVAEIQAICQKYDILLIEDAAEALGSTYKGQKCGTFGDLAILSFNGNKIITTSGGGALVCRTKKQKQRAVYLATQARDDAPHYQHSEIGYNYRLSNISAGIGRGQMQVLDKHVGYRRGNNEFYKEVFKDIEGVSVFTEPSEEYYSNHWLTSILIDPEKTAGVDNNLIREALAKENIESRPLWKPMHLQPVFEKAPYYGGSVAEELFQEGLCLPSASRLIKSELTFINSVIRTCFR